MSGQAQTGKNRRRMNFRAEGRIKEQTKKKGDSIIKRLSGCVTSGRFPPMRLSVRTLRASLVAICL